VENKLSWAAHGFIGAIETLTQYTPGFAGGI